MIRSINKKRKDEAAIDEAILQARELGEQLGACCVQSAIKEMKEGLKAP